MTKVKMLFDDLNELLSQVRVAKEPKPDHEVCFNVLIRKNFPWVKSPLQVRIHQLINDPELAWMPLIKIIRSKDIKRLPDFSSALLQEEIYLSKSPVFLKNLTLTHGFDAYVKEFNNKERDKSQIKSLEDKAEELLTQFEFSKADDLVFSERDFFDNEWYEGKRAIYRKKEQDIKSLKNKIEELLIKFEFDKANELFLSEESFLDAKWYESKRTFSKKKEVELNTTSKSQESDYVNRLKIKTQPSAINVEEEKDFFKREMKNPALNNRKNIKSGDDLSADLLVVSKKCLNLSKILSKEFEGKENDYQEELNELSDLTELMMDCCGRVTRKIESKKWLNDAENILIGIISNILKSEKEASKLVKVLVAKAGAAAAVGGIGGLISAYGVASTGTAIASLSGAAEATAVMYWLGSLVGLGTTAGAIITGGVGILGGYVAFRMLKNRPRSMDDLSEDEKVIVTACASLIKAVKEGQESNEIITKEKGDFLENKVLVPLKNNLMSYKSSEAEKVLGKKYMVKLDFSIDDFCKLISRLRSW